MAKRHTRNRRHRRVKRTSRRRQMRGGAFTQDERQELRNKLFSDNQINAFDDFGVSFNNVIEKYNTLQNNDYPNRVNLTPEEMDYIAGQVTDEIYHEQMGQNNNNDDIHYLDDGNMDALDLNDLNISRDSSEGYTSSEAMSDNDDEFLFGGKRRKRRTRKNKKHSKKSKKSRKQKGGRCYGNGIGANSYNPNYSIYNTNMLKLFPYKA